MHLPQKFFTVVGIVLLTISAVMAAWAIYFAVTYVPPAAYPECRMFSGLCGPLALQGSLYATALLATTAYGLLALAQAWHMHKHPRRYRRRRG